MLSFGEMLERLEQNYCTTENEKEKQRNSKCITREDFFLGKAKIALIHLNMSLCK